MQAKKDKMKQFSDKVKDQFAPVVDDKKREQIEERL